MKPLTALHSQVTFPFFGNKNYNVQIHEICWQNYCFFKFFFFGILENILILWNKNFLWKTVSYITFVWVFSISEEDIHPFHNWGRLKRSSFTVLYEGKDVRWCSY